MRVLGASWGKLSKLLLNNLCSVCNFRPFPCNTWCPQIHNLSSSISPKCEYPVSLGVRIKRPSCIYMVKKESGEGGDSHLFIHTL